MPQREDYDFKFDQFRLFTDSLPSKDDYPLQPRDDYPYRFEQMEMFGYRRLNDPDSEITEKKIDIMATYFVNNLSFMLKNTHERYHAVVMEDFCSINKIKNLCKELEGRCLDGANLKRIKEALVTRYRGKSKGTINSMFRRYKAESDYEAHMAFYGKPSKNEVLYDRWPGMIELGLLPEILPGPKEDRSYPVDEVPEPPPEEPIRPEKPDYRIKLQEPLFSDPGKGVPRAAMESA